MVRGQVKWAWRDWGVADVLAARTIGAGRVPETSQAKRLGVPVSNRKPVSGLVVYIPLDKGTNIQH